MIKGLAFAFAVMSLIGHRFGPAETLTVVSIALPFGIGDVAIGMLVNGVTVIMLTLVALVGAIVSTYSRNNKAGEAREEMLDNGWLHLFRLDDEGGVHQRLVDPIGVPGWQPVPSH